MSGMSTELQGEQVVLRALDADDVERLRAIRLEPEVLQWWGSLEDDFPLGDEPTATRLTILVDGEVAGMLQFTEEPEPDYRHAEIDVFLGARFHGRGHGRDAVRTATRHLMDDRGHHRVVIAPAVANAAAVRAYERAGFRRVGVMRKAARNASTGEWEDELFMELVREDV